MGATRREEEELRKSIEIDGKRVLIVKLRYIGDTMSIIPVIENLKQNAPNAEIDVMVNKGTEEVLAYHPGIGKILAYDRRAAKQGAVRSLLYHWRLISLLRARRYHAVIDFTHGDRASFLSYLTGASYRISSIHSSTLSRILMNNFISSEPSGMHIVDYQLEALRLFGMDHFKREIKVHVPAAAEQKINRILQDKRICPEEWFAAIHPGARGRWRQWPQERFAEIARRIRAEYKGAGVILFGGPTESALVDSVERRMGFPATFKSPGLSLLETTSLFSRCRIFIGNDSAPAHLAAAAGCPTVTLFGPTFPSMWRPLGALGEVVFKNAPCCGCRQEECIRPEQTCMEMIEVDEVWEKIQKILATHNKQPATNP